MTFINFALSKHLVRNDELLTDQCGSLAYVSPEVLSGEFFVVVNRLLRMRRAGLQ